MMVDRLIPIGSMPARLDGFGKSDSSRFSHTVTTPSGHETIVTTLVDPILRMSRPAKVMAGGAVGTALMSLVFALMEVQTRYAIGIFDAIAKFARMPDNLYIGFFLFVVAGVVIWPLLFLAVEDYIPFGPDPAVRGMVFGILLWIPFVLTALGELIIPLFVLYLVISFIAHLIYGFSMGAVFAALSTDPQSDRYRQ